MDSPLPPSLSAPLIKNSYTVNSADANENLTHGRGIDRRWEGQDGVTT